MISAPFGNCYPHPQSSCHASLSRLDLLSVFTAAVTRRTCRLTV
nr:MAG TPA: hypothetical protein [Caudoviricetes sp.]